MDTLPKTHLEAKNTHPHKLPLAELHSHLGGAAHAAVLWTLAHDQGIKLPKKDYWAFKKMVTIPRGTHVKGVTALDRDKYHWTELIQSSPLAMELTVQNTIGGAYRANNVILHELRFNPMKRNRAGERDLDYIIIAAIRGMEKALFEYQGVSAGLIMMLDRSFPYKLNYIIYEKALKYQRRGVVGIDIAGPQIKGFSLKKYLDLFLDARARGFGITLHTGEEGSLDEMRFVVVRIQPHRIGHGFMAVRDKRLMGAIKEQGITLELCPTSNLNIGVIKNIAEMKRIYRKLLTAGIKLTVNSDGPEMHDTNLWRELTFLQKNKIFTRRELDAIRENAFHATFIR